MSDAVDLRDVRVLDFPLDVWQRAQEHGDALVRELTLIAQSRVDGESEPADDDGPAQLDLPRRLVALVGELTHRYDGMATDVERQRDDALDRGEARVDLTYTVPAHVGEACRHLGQVFDDADFYCRQGEHLLTLATPPEALAFRRWFLGEFVRQLEGEPPVSWTTYAAAHGEPGNDPAPS
ncbi:hypothetical protein GCM10027446_28060 [Angustibacter peucedani]